MFRRSTVAALAIAGGVSILALAAPAHADGLTEGEQQQVKELVREYLLENPEILVEAMEALRSKEMAAQSKRQETALAENRDEIFHKAGDPVLGNPEGDVTMVEFFDYQCGYCKRVFKPVMDTVQDDGNLRFVLKELPILGPESVLAARYSLAAAAQDKYAEFHGALMTRRGPITEEALKTLAAELGLDVEQLAEDAESDAVNQQIRANLELAAALGIRGTPAFIIGDRVIPGAVGQDQLENAIDAARAKSDS